MKVLLRNYFGENYVWKDAEYIEYKFVIDGYEIEETDVISIKDDDREEYVQCGYCGQVFKKDSPELEAHKNRWKSLSTCLDCTNLSTNREENKGNTYNPLPNGRYERVHTDVVRLCCRYANYWNPAAITPDCDRKFCKYKKCADIETLEYKDIFAQHPGVFDDIATVDKILEVGYKGTTDSGWYGYSMDYFLKGRNDIRAVVNDIGIVDFFIISYDGHNWKVVYSKKLDKLFDISSYRYIEWYPPNLKASVKEYIKQKISELYN